MTVAGANDKKLRAAIEEIRPAISGDELAIALREAMDAMDVTVEEGISQVLTLSDDGHEEPAAPLDATSQPDYGELDYCSSLAPVAPAIHTPDSDTLSRPESPYDPSSTSHRQVLPILNLFASVTLLPMPTA